jgi:ABC-type hemin transport system substrate-binding protein
VQTYNAAIPGLVNTRAAAGKHVVFLDNYAAFAKGTYPPEQRVCQRRRVAEQRYQANMVGALGW